MKQHIVIKRVYEAVAKSDGFRVLVDRIWPRGVSKEAAELDEWAKELAPSPSLRKWFGHDPERWVEFRKKYRAELRQNDAVAAFLAAHKDRKKISLIYAAKDEAHNHALVLQDYLETYDK